MYHVICGRAVKYKEVISFNCIINDGAQCSGIFDRKGAIHSQHITEFIENKRDKMRQSKSINCRIWLYIIYTYICIYIYVYIYIMFKQHYGWGTFYWRHVSVRKINNSGPLLLTSNIFDSSIDYRWISSAISHFPVTGIGQPCWVKINSKGKKGKDHQYYFRGSIQLDSIMLSSDMSYIDLRATEMANL